MTRQLHLNCMLGGIGLGSWRHPEAQPEKIRSLQYLADLARVAERARFDAIFCGDLMSVSATRTGDQLFGLEPFTTYSALAAVTGQIGLIVTASTTYDEPFNVARRLASLDHISCGRAGWNIVTTLVDDVARQFGDQPHPDPASRYDRAEEFVEVCKKLWHSWGRAAVVPSANSARVDGSLNHPIDHQGRHFAVRGPLDIPRPVQGWPVLAQAGSSGLGQAFAARHAELIFTAQPDLARAKAFAATIRHEAARFGRSSGDILLMPGLASVLASTEAEARRTADELAGLSINGGRLKQLSGLLGIDLAALPQDDPIPHDLLPPTGLPSTHSRTALYVELIREKHLTPRQLSRQEAHLSFIGTPEGLADLIEDWFTSGAADGFNLMWPWLPGGLDIFADEVVPLLQKKGIFRREYAGTTLRNHFGLATPADA